MERIDINLLAEIRLAAMRLKGTIERFFQPARDRNRASVLSALSQQVQLD
jgi:hypothetical protein